MKTIWELKAEGNARKEYVHGEVDNSVSQIQPAKRLFHKGREKPEGELEKIIQRCEVSRLLRLCLHYSWHRLLLFVPALPTESDSLRVAGHVDIDLTLEVHFTNSVATLKIRLWLFPHFSEGQGFFCPIH